MGCAGSVQHDEVAWSDDVVKKAFMKAIEDQIAVTATIMAKPSSVGVGTGDWCHEAGDGIDGAVVQKMEDIPGSTTLIEFVKFKMNEMVDHACGDERTKAAMEKVFAEMKWVNTDMRECFHGQMYQSGTEDAVWAISSYYQDEDYLGGEKLRALFLPIAKDAVQNIDAGPGVYDNIKAAWDAIPAIPFVYEKPEVEWQAIEEVVVDGMMGALDKWMMAVERRQRCGRNCSAPELKVVFVDVPGSGDAPMDGTTVPYACQADSDDLIPDNPWGGEFTPPEKGISLTG
jgi:hypothetical protein